MSARVFGVAVIGTGIMGRRMLAALKDHPRFRVATLWDPDAPALHSAVADTPGARAASDVDDLLGDAAVDLVYIASPPAAHRALVEKTVQSGRACLCEKPLASDLDDARALRDAVVASASPFAINFPFASAPASRRLGELVHSRVLGDIRSVTITARFAQWPRPWQAGASPWLSGAVEGGFTREVLSHFVFLALRLFGPAAVADVELTRVPGHAETALRARLVHAGIAVTIDAAVAGDIADRNRFEVVGSAATASLIDWSRLEFDGEISDRVDATPSTLDRLATMLDGRMDHELATAGEGLAVVRCIEAMLEG